MPIYKDSGLDSVSIKIIRFLQKHPDKAFRPKEIAEKIGEHPSTVSDRLVRLHFDRGLVENQIDGSHAYWHIV
jgi:DNA-binding MarR family transcriptional regulator